MNSISLDEFIEMIRQKYSQDDAVRVELAIDGIFWREADGVIARYSRMSKKVIAMIRKQVKTENNKDYFTI